MARSGTGPSPAPGLTLPLLQREPRACRSAPSASVASPASRSGAKRSLDMERFAVETPPNSPQRSPRKAAVRRAALQSQAAMAARGLPAPVYSSNVAVPRVENVDGVYGSHRPHGGLPGSGPSTPPLSPASAASRQASAEDKLNNQMGISNQLFGPLPGLDHPLQAPGLLSLEHVAELPLLPAPVRIRLPCSGALHCSTTHACCATTVLILSNDTKCSATLNSSYHARSSRSKTISWLSGKWA